MPAHSKSVARSAGLVHFSNAYLGLTPRALCLHPLRWLGTLPGAVIDGVSFVDCVFSGVRASEVVEASGLILFRNVKIEPAAKGRSLESQKSQA